MTPKSEKVLGNDSDSRHEATIPRPKLDTRVIGSSNRQESNNDITTELFSVWSESYIQDKSKGSWSTRVEAE
jgi:hypothetical protein